MRRHTYWWVIALGFLLLGLVCFAFLGYYALAGMITCGGDCANKNAVDILLGEMKYVATACLAFILLVVGAAIFVVFRWGLSLDTTPLWKPYQRNRRPP